MSLPAGAPLCVLTVASIRLQQEQEVSALQEDNRTLKCEILALQEEILALKQEITALQEENLALKQENLSQKQENSALKQDILNLQQELRQLKGRYQDKSEVGVLNRVSKVRAVVIYRNEGCQ